MVGLPARHTDKFNQLTLTVDNDFHETFDIFNLFDGLEVPDLDQKASVNGIEVNGH